MLHETVFTNIREVTEVGMVAINWGLYKVACMGPAEGELYVKTDDLKFLVH